jgi:hypothetical protein
MRMKCAWWWWAGLGAIVLAGCAGEGVSNSAPGDEAGGDLGDRPSLVEAMAAMDRGATVAAGSDNIVTAQGWSCVEGRLWSAANGRYVSTEISFGGGAAGLLRARATDAGPWEQYRFCSVSGTGIWYIVSLANGKIVSTEVNYRDPHKNVLRARTDTGGPWEQFQFSYNSDATVSLLSVAAVRWVSVELDYSGLGRDELRARSWDSGPWERFNIK